MKTHLALAALCASLLTSTIAACAQDSAQPQTTAPGASSGIGQKDSNSNSTKTGTDPSSAAKPAVGENSASTQRLRLGPLAPSTAPTGLPKNRPVIGVAMGGGAALAMSEIGVLAWMEQHHVPVDVIAGTSMGSILGALYSTGKTPDQMTQIMTEDSVNSVFRIGAQYSTRNFRRREDSRDVPGAITVGLKHGASLRNSLLTDSGLNELLDREFLSYNDQTDFNDLPIPFRCQATDLNDARTVTFSRGSLQDAVRASASIPGIFRPFAMDGHEYVDGAILANLPTEDVRAMKADVVIAISLPLSPVGKGDLNSIIGVLQRAFAVGIEANEERERKQADILIMPDISGFTANDYLKTKQLADKGYNAAEAHKDELMKYALSDADWDAYLAARHHKERGAAGTLMMVKVKAPRKDVEYAATRIFAPIVNQPLDTDKVEKLLAEVRADGRYDADYTVGYDSKDSSRPILLVAINDKKTGPPFLQLGANIAAQTGGVTRATFNSIITYQDIGGYGSELRGKLDFGFLTNVEAEYYKRIGWQGFFAAPRANITRQPFYIYSGKTRLSERQLQSGGAAFDVGFSDKHNYELRAGYIFQQVDWTTTIGNDFMPDYHGSTQTARVRFIYDSQDRALVPQYGIRSTTTLSYLFDTPGSPTAPKLTSQVEMAHTFAKKHIVLLNAEGGTMLNRNVAEPFRFTLGGPLRLAASAIDELRGTDYFLATPGYLHRIAKLPAPLGQSIYVGGTYEFGQMRRPDGPNIFRQDVYFGIVAETPFGVVTAAPAIGSDGQRKFVFTLGRLF